MKKLDLKKLKEKYIPYKFGEDCDWEIIDEIYTSVPELIEALEEAKEIISFLHDDTDFEKQPSDWLERFEDE